MSTATGAQADILSYKPSACYFRRAIHGTENVRRLKSVGLAAVDELEALKAWCREQGLQPPRFRMLREEWEDRSRDQPAALRLLGE